MRIVTPSRLHAGLLDLHGGRGRVDGGAGFALDAPSIEVEVERGPLRVVAAPGVHPEILRHAREAALRLSRARRVRGTVRILRGYEPHVGLGSGTQAALAAAWGLARLHRLGLTVEEAAETAGRGGTSGIGVWAFEGGGFIVDGGHSRRVKRGFFPSAASRAPPPPRVARLDMPDWPVVLACPSGPSPTPPRVHGRTEVEAFRRLCPIPSREVEEASRLVLLGLLPAVAEGDLPAFGEAVNRMQETGFKKREVALQGPRMEALLRAARRAGAAGAGMSSFGPLAYALGPRPRTIRKALQAALDRMGGGWTLITRPRNRGAGVLP
ncbi:MAG: beta-ribofuranosylaminobenzene 5'-phosphate synthase [Halobacteria archaeon]